MAEQAENAENPGGRRYLLATAVTTFGRWRDWDLPGLAAAREDIVRLFTERLRYQLFLGLGLNPSKAELEDQLKKVCRSPDLTAEDCVAVYIGTHGDPGEGPHGHRLLMQDTVHGDISGTSVSTESLAADMLRGTKVRNLLLMFDCCYAARGGNALMAAAHTEANLAGMGEPDRTVVVMNSARVGDVARPGVFPARLRAAVEDRATAGHGPEYLMINTLVDRMNANCGPGEQQCRAFGDLHSTRFFPNPRYDPELTGLDLHMQHVRERKRQQEERQLEYQKHLRPKAKASPDSDGGWWFEGRQQAQDDIAEWLRNPSPDRPLLAITADPGSGKSALLGMVASVTDAQHRPAVPLRRLGLSADTFAVGSVDTVIYAKNQQSGQVLQGIAAAAGVEAKTVRQLIDRLRDRERPLTVIVDALDESAAPYELCENLLLNLAIHSHGRVRLIVGTRPHLLPVFKLSRQSAENVIDLDAEKYADFKALKNYALQGLRDSSPDSPYASDSVPTATAAAVAEAIARAAGHSFLVARMTSLRLASDPVIPDPHDSRWRAALPRHAGRAMRTDLERLGDQRQRAIDLLRPLAHHEGQGLPFEDIWPRLASELSSTPYSEDDIRWLMKAAGSYVVDTVEDGGSVYSLYHEALGEWLREQDDLDPAAIHAAFTRVLHSRLRRTVDGTDWAGASAYTRKYIAAHAVRSESEPQGDRQPQWLSNRHRGEAVGHAAPVPSPPGSTAPDRGSRLEQLLADPEFLVHADPAVLLPLVDPQRMGSPITRRQARVYRAAVSRLRTSDGRTRRQLLAFTGAQHGMPSLVAALIDPPAEPPLTLRPRWATGGRGRPGHDGRVYDVTTVRLATGDALVSCGEDAEVRVWDLRTGALLRVLTGPDDAIYEIETTEVSGRPVIAAVGGDPTVWLWDAETGDALHVLSGHTERVTSVVCSEVEPGRPLLITGGDDHTVMVWDPQHGEEVHSLISHAYPIWRIGVCQSAPTVCVTTSSDGTAIAWDVTTGEELHVLEGHNDYVDRVVCAVSERGEHLAATTSLDAEIRVWDLARGTGRALPGRFSADTFGLALTSLPGPVTAVSADLDGNAALWDLERGVRVRALRGHRAGEFTSVSACRMRGRDIAMASGDSVVPVWDLASGQCLDNIAFPEETYVCTVPETGTVVGRVDSDVYVLDVDWRTADAGSHGSHGSR
ncbi:hypothetical protein ACIHCQ_20240 [Streptomyces sp. NPDC052236]|uniref:hypothetical protein n=1 Tax=Streptomyces sp. NPDC052236 TaxID=3365686 RepID=UPI0037D13BF6